MGSVDSWLAMVDNQLALAPSALKIGTRFFRRLLRPAMLSEFVYRQHRTSGRLQEFL